MIIYLDESGDLGLDFNNGKKCSKHFVITLLVCYSIVASQHIKNSIKKTLRRKINYNQKKSEQELKGTNSILSVKKYFYMQATKTEDWSLCSLVLDKRKILESLRSKPSIHRLYNFLAREVLKQVDFSKVETLITLVVDKSKGKREIKEFDSYLTNNLEAVLPLNVNIKINHEKSHENPGLQAVDLFSWGIYRAVEHQDQAWYSCFKERIVTYEMFVHLPQI